jgi:hypothetical protein
MTIDQFLAFPLEIHRDCALADLRFPLSLDAASAAALRTNRAAIASGQVSQLEIIEITQRHAAYRIAEYGRENSVKERTLRHLRGLKWLCYGFDAMEFTADRGLRLADLFEGLWKDPEVRRLTVALEEVANGREEP